MSCTQTQRLIFAERDAPLAPAQQAELSEHLERCPDCARLRAKLTDSVAAWRTATANVDVPNAAIEWQAVRLRLPTAKPSPGVRRWRPSTLAWIGVPLAVLAAVAVIFFSPQRSGTVAASGSDSAPASKMAALKAPEFARAEFVDVPGNSSSTTIYVDNASGWLVVWADTPGKG
jgi:anti-sigma factor RsiW